MPKKEKTPPVVSIVIPVYNTSKELLSECIESVCRQSYKKLEVIVVDDGSDAATARHCDIIASDDDRVRAVHRENGGVSSARNVGIELAAGEFIMFVDADDVLRLDAVELLVESSDTADVVVAQVKRFYGKADYKVAIVQKDEGSRLLDGESALLELLYDRGVPTGPFNKLMSRKAIGDNRLDTRYAYAEDLEFNSRVFTGAKKVRILNDETYFYRIADGSATQSGFREERMDGLEATSAILKRSQLADERSIVKAAEYRHFMEAIFIGASIGKSKRKYKNSLSRCYTAISDTRYSVAGNSLVRLDNRVLSLASFLHPSVPVLLFSVKLYVRKLINDWKG